MSTEPEETLTFEAVAEDTDTMETVTEPVAETEILPALPESPFAGASLAGQPAPVLGVAGELAQPRVYPTFGDMLEATRLGFDDKPADAILPCGRCGAVFTAPEDADPPRRWFETGVIEGPWTEWEAARPLYQARRHAHAAGWERDASDIWTCPDCRQDQDGHWIAAKRAESRAATAAAREHRSILAYADGRFEDAMEARGGEFTCRWSYAEDAAPGWAA